jgi:hypothetical protein
LAITTVLDFASISKRSRGFGLDCVPLVFKRVDVDKVEKRAAVKWKPYQERPSTDAEQALWAPRFRYAGGATPLGPVANAFVLDTDSVEGDEYVAKRGMPPTWRVRTLHGGHDYFEWPDFVVRNSVKELGPFDIRALGGLCVTPGSGYYPDARDLTRRFVYEWVEGYSPADLPLAPAPNWLLADLRKRAEREAPPSAPALPQPYRGRVRAWARKAYDANLDLLRCAEPGMRNTTAWNVARRLGQLCAGGELNSATVFAALYAIANSWPNSAHTIDTMQRAFKAGEVNPRSAPPPRIRPSPFVTINLDGPLGSEPLNLDDGPLGHADPSADI